MIEKNPEHKLEWIHGFIGLPNTCNYEPGDYIKEVDIVDEVFDGLVIVANFEWISNLGQWLFTTILDYYEVEALCDLGNDKMLYASNKYISKKIKVVRKLGWNDIGKYVTEYYSSIESEDEFKKAKKIGYKRFAFLKYCSIAKELGYTEEFARITFKEGIRQINSLKDLSKENVSKETMIMLLTEM